jgi:hypothetical protein
MISVLGCAILMGHSVLKSDFIIATPLSNERLMILRWCISDPRRSKASRACQYACFPAPNITTSCTFCRLLKIIVDARAVRKAVNSAALRKALATPFLSSNVSVPLGDVVDGAEPVVNGTELIVDGIEPVADDILPDFVVDPVFEDVCDGESDDGKDGYSGMSDPVCELPEADPDRDRDDIDDPTFSSTGKGVESVDSTRVTTLIPMPSMLDPGMKRVVEPSFRII